MSDHLFVFCVGILREGRILEDSLSQPSYDLGVVSFLSPAIEPIELDRIVVVRAILDTETGELKGKGLYKVFD